MPIPSDGRLYNCCTGWTAPDWTAFVSLRLGGCVDHGGETEGCVSAAEAQFFTVYGVDAEGLCEAITDTDTGANLDTGRQLLADLAKVSGLPSNLCGFLKVESPALYLAARTPQTPGESYMAQDRPAFTTPAEALALYPNGGAKAYQVEPSALPDWARFDAAFCFRVVASVEG